MKRTLLVVAAILTLTLIIALPGRADAASPVDDTAPGGEHTGSVEPAATEPTSVSIPFGAPSLNLTDRERGIVRRHARGHSVKPMEVEIEIGELIPEFMELHSFSEVVRRKIPALSAYRYFLIEDEVVVVDPEHHRIIDVIEE